MKLRYALPLGVLAGALGLALALPGWRVPDRWNPWAPLDIRESPNWLTGYKLWRLRDDRELCDQVLRTSPLRYRPMADATPAEDCPVRNGVRVMASDVAFSSSFLATCPLAAAYALFEVHDLQPAARAVFGQPVARVEHLGSFACRNIANSRWRSQHASANALDIAAFRLRDGRRISVARDWRGTGDEARFLRAVHRAACERFNLTLGPDYNAAHRDHFHVDMGLLRLCR